MQKKNLFWVNLIIWGFLASCFGPFKANKEDDKNKDAENFVLLELASHEFLEINGKWQDNFNTTHEIFAEKSILTETNGHWNTSSSYGNSNRSIVKFDNTTKTLYVKANDEPSWADCNGNGTKGETGVPCYSRIVWTSYNNKYYYCEIVYNKASLAEAEGDTTTADSSNPDSSGCGGFSWTRFDTQLN